MAPPVSASDSKAAPPSPATPPADPDLPAPDDTLPHNQFEAFSGRKYGISDTFQMGLGAAYLPFSWLFLGASGWTNFSNKHSVLGEIGFKGQPALVFSIQPTALVGAGILSDHEIVTGRFAEKASLSGSGFMAGGELRLQVDPVPFFGFYVAPGFMHEERGGVGSRPASLLSGDDPKSAANFFTIALGFRLGLAPNRPFPEKEEEVRRPSPSTTQAPKPAAPPSSSPPAPEVEKSFEMKIEEQKKKIVEDLKKQGKETLVLAEKIDDVKKKVLLFEEHLRYWKDGIDLTHLLAQDFQKTIDALGTDPKAPVDPALEKDLDLLQEAVKFDAEGNRVSTTPPSMGIQVGSRILYPDLQKPYGEKLLRQLKEIETKLRNQTDRKETHQKVKDSVVALENYLKKKTRWVELKDLQDERDKLESAEKELSAEGPKNGLDGNEAWKGLKQDFSDKKSDLKIFHKNVENVVQLAAIFQINANEFQDKVKTPDEALKTFQKALGWVEKQKIARPIASEYTYLSYLSYSLDRFVSTHSVPQMKEAEAKQWETAIVEAKKLKERIQLFRPGQRAGLPER